MMDLPEDVIVDLLPAYFSGDASPASRAIVDAYFTAHPAFADAMRAAQETDLPLPRIASDDGGHEAIRRVRKRLSRRAVLTALAIFCSVSPFTFTMKRDSLVFFMWRDAPETALCYAVVAFAAWIALWMTNRSRLA